MDLARRTEIHIEINGVDVTDDINNALISLTYVDNGEDAADDIQLQLDDREGIWLGELFAVENPDQTAIAQPAPDPDPVPVALSQPITHDNVSIGQKVIANGFPYRTPYLDESNYSQPLPIVSNLIGKVIAITPMHHRYETYVQYPVNVADLQSGQTIGWFAFRDIAFIADDIGAPVSDQPSPYQPANPPTRGVVYIKDQTMRVSISQVNWDGNGGTEQNRSTLDCGTFEIDTVEGSGFPSVTTFKATSLPYPSTVRMQKKTRGWENIRLSGIAYDIAAQNQLGCLFESDYDPLYDRREQMQTSDILFLRELCKDAGISLKITDNTLVLFDEILYEQNDAITNIVRGETGILSYRFITGKNDTGYSKCHVSYTDPATGVTIEYTYTPRLNADGSKNDGTGLVLEINERVTTREEARQLAMKRMRQKNKNEFAAEFTLVGDIRLVGGVTINVSGWGIFDGKYIIESATHDVTGGYTVALKLRRTLNNDEQ